MVPRTRLPTWRHVLRHRASLSLRTCFLSYFAVTGLLLIFLVAFLVRVTLGTPEHMRVSILLLSGSAVVFVLSLGRFLARHVVQPLQALVRAVPEVATAEIVHPVNEDFTGELGTLARAFNKMTRDLARSRSAYESINHHLENLVRSRTEELARKAGDLECANAELKQLDHLKSDFVSNVSHELRTPLTVLRSFTEILQDPENHLADAERHEILACASQQVTRLTRLVDDLLDFAKMSTPEFHCRPRPSRLEPLLRSCLIRAREQAKARSIRLEWQAPEGLDRVSADPARITQVVERLLDNALKFTDPGGRVVVTARPSEGRHAPLGPIAGPPAAGGTFAGVSSEAPEDGPYVAVYVCDTGRGIPLAEQQRIFGTFVQAGDVLTEKPRGLGLGLAIAGRIVVEHGGALWVESSPGHGAVFAFTIPAERGAERPHPSRASTAAPSGLLELMPPRRAALACVPEDGSEALACAPGDGSETRRA